MSLNSGPSLDIIIVNWNSGNQLRDCLLSVPVAIHNSYNLVKVIVVDNASSDDSLILEDLPSLPLTIIQNRVNRGFAAACNQGASVSDSDYILFLNPDTRLFGDSLYVPLNFMQQSENYLVGICGISLVDADNLPVSSCCRFPTLSILIGKMSGLSRFLPIIYPPHVLSANELKHDREVDQIIGAFFLVRRALFNELQGFDETFYVYYEEVDFSLRAKKLGYLSYHLADVKAFHKGAGCSGSVRSERLFYSLRSRYLYARKHFKYADLVLLVVLSLTVEFAGRILLTEHISGLRETISAYNKYLMFLVKPRQI